MITLRHMFGPTSLPLFVCLLLSLSAYAQQPGAPTQQQQDVFELLALFDTLDTSNLPFVEFTDGWSEGTPLENNYRFGFLLRSDGKTFRVRGIDMHVQELEVTPPGTANCHRCGFTPADLRAYANALAARLTAAGRNGAEKPFYDRYSHLKFSLGTGALLVAHACARAGHQKEVDALWRALPRSWRARDRLVRGLGGAELDRDLRHFLVRDFDNPEFDWEALAARHRLWLESFPDDFYAKEVRERADAIDQRKNDQPPAADASTADFVKGLSGTFGRVRDFELVEPELTPPAAAQRSFETLVAQGLSSVPALIAALDDPALTRVTVFDQGHIYVRSRGSLANDALRQISGLPLTGTSEWQDWLERARATSIDDCHKAFLLSGHGWSYRAAAPWLQRHPGDPGPVLLAAANNEPQRVVMLKALGMSPAASDPRVRKAIRAAARRGVWGMRFRLLVLGDPALVDDALQQWQQGKVPDVDDLGILMKAGRPDFIKALRNRMGDEAVRLLTVSALEQLDPTTLLTWGKLGDRDAFTAELRAFLVELLEDATPFEDVADVLRRGRLVKMQKATHADVAAATLAELWPGAFAFDPCAAPDVRRKQIKAMLDGR